MKKRYALLLALLMIGAAPVATAQETVIEITYEGQYVEFPEFNFKLYIPADWIVYPPEKEVYFMAGNEAQTQYMWMEVYETEGYTMDGVLRELESTDGYTNVLPIYYNGISFATYQFDAEGVFGAATLTSDGYMILLKFSPSDDAQLVDTANMIMASLTAL